MNIDPEEMHEMMGIVHDICWNGMSYDYDSLTKGEWVLYPWYALYDMNLVDIGEHREPDGDMYYVEHYIKPTTTGIAYINQYVLSD